MGEEQEIVTTGVDTLIDLLRKKKLVSVEEAAKIINVREQIVQNWIDFLVEEGIVGVEYKFITPYIFLRTDEKQATVIFDTKEEFFRKALARGIEVPKIHFLWTRYLSSNLESIKADFFKKMDQRNIAESKRETLWVKYEQVLRQEVSEK